MNPRSLKHWNSDERFVAQIARGKMTVDAHEVILRLGCHPQRDANPPRARWSYHRVNGIQVGC